MITFPTPLPGTVMHLYYLDQKDKFSERLVRVTSASETHLKAFDLIKEEPRNFVRDQLYWAAPVTTKKEQDDLFYLLHVRRHFNAP